MFLPQSVISICCFLASAFFFISCTSSREIVYFQDFKDKQADTITTGNIPDHVIREGDMLHISVSSSNTDADEQFNRISASSTNRAGLISTGILVDKSGHIDLPYMGRLAVSGLNTTQARDTIQWLLGSQLRNPVVSLKLTNFQVSVLGDVAKPGTYTVTNEKINILQALSLAGDLNITARRNNIVIIRGQEGKEILTRVDLRSKNLVQSGYFNLKSNDVVYVEPSKGKIMQNDARTFQIATLAATLLSLVTIIITRANF